MGFFDRFFRKNTNKAKAEIKTADRETLDVSKEIDEILYILKELRFMDAYSIEREMDQNKKNYDKSILYRLMIDIDEDSISELKRYVSKEKFGYGQIKLDEIKTKLESKVDECNEKGRNKEEIVEEIIAIAKEYIKDYQNKLYRFNNTIRLIEENSNLEAEVIAMIAYWIEVFKEQEFGFPIDLEKELNDEAIKLKNLPEGGYGPEKIEEFIKAGKKEIEEGKKNHLSDKDILNGITSTLVNQYRSRYEYDLDKLSKRIQTIEVSTFIDEEEKQKNITELRIAFKTMYGHIINLEESVKEMEHALKTLDYGGYGKSKIDEFEMAANKIIEDGHTSNKDEKAILAKIDIEYKRMLDKYNERKKTLEEQLSAVEALDVSKKEKNARRKRLKDDFKADSGHKIELKKAVNEMIEDLANLEGGGYGQSEIREFKVECEKILTKAEGEKSQDVLGTYRRIQKVYDKYVDDYIRALNELKGTEKQIDNSDSLSSIEKEDSKEDYKINFELKVGRPLNLGAKVKEYIKELQTLPHGGYGKTAIIEFEDYCLNIIKSEKTDKEKSSLICQRKKRLKNTYENNLRLFTEWKKERMKEFTGDDFKSYENELDKKITHMLSLSPIELEKYYQDDDKQKKAAYIAHNTEVAVKNLARKEAQEANDEQLYYKRLEEFHDGKEPYSKEVINKTIEELEKKALISNDQEDEILDVVNYIESTLYMQIARVSVPR